MLRQFGFATLLPLIARRILDVVVLQPDRAWYRSELARKLEVAPSTLQRPLISLANAGVVVTRQDGNRVYYTLNTLSPTYAEVRGLIVKTSGLIHVLRDALRGVADGIEVAFVHGSFARGEENADSDVDLIVIGSVGLFELASPIHRASEELGREVNPIVYPRPKFEEKRASGNHFVTTVMARPKLFVIGGADDLAGPAGAKEGDRGADQPR